MWFIRLIRRTPAILFTSLGFIGKPNTSSQAILPQLTYALFHLLYKTTTTPPFWLDAVGPGVGGLKVVCFIVNIYAAANSSHLQQ